MELRAAHDLALDLMGQHLTGWEFRWHNRKTAYGSCRYGTKEIFLSRPLTELCDPAEVENTIRHEIAHAIAGPTAGHGPIWRVHARRLGARPKACTDGPTVPAKWEAICPTCKRVVYTRHKMTQALRNKAAYCRPCRDRLGWTLQVRVATLVVWRERTT